MNRLSSEGKIAETSATSLRIVILFLGGNVPARTNEPPAALPGRNRSGRAAQVAGSRGDISRLFEVIGRCLGHTAHTPPKREVLLEEGAEFLVFVLFTVGLISFWGFKPRPFTLYGSCEED